MQILLILIVVLGGMGLSVEAGLLGPLGSQVGELWATLSIFGVGAALTFFLMLFFSPRESPSFFSQPPFTTGWWYFRACLCCGINRGDACYWHCADDDWDIGWASISEFNHRSLWFIRNHGTKNR